MLDASMLFLSVLCALLIEQLYPLRNGNVLYVAIKNFAARVKLWFDAGQAPQGKIAWIVMMASLIFPTLFFYWLILKADAFFILLFNILIAYLTLGFRHYSHYFTSIQLALRVDDQARARVLLAEWTKLETSNLNANQIAQMAVEQALIAAHRNVFGVLFWFLTPFGAVGAVLYRIAEYLARAWNNPKESPFGYFAQRAFYWIDWIPVRLTAIAFAAVGNFEEAIYAWRNGYTGWQDANIGILLSTGGGAMGIKLGYLNTAEPFFPAETASEATTEPLPNEDITAQTLQGTVGLVWRTLLLWLAVTLLLSIAVWLN